MSDLLKRVKMRLKRNITLSSKIAPIVWRKDWTHASTSILFSLFFNWNILRKPRLFNTYLQDFKSMIKLASLIGHILSKTNAMFILLIFQE